MATCCGCSLVEDYGTSVVEGNGSQFDPYSVHQVDPEFDRPIVRVRKTAAVNQSITTATPTALTFDVEYFDTNTMHDNAVNNSRLTIPIAGFYLMGADVVWASSTAQREVFFRLDGITELDRQSAINLNGVTHHQNLQYLWFFEVAQYIEVIAFQTSGAGLNVTPTTDEPVVFWAMYLGKKI